MGRYAGLPGVYNASGITLADGEGAAIALDASGKIVLGAGSAAIGKLAANSGVDIGDVDILSIAAGDNNIGNVDIASAIPAGTNAIGKLAANSGVDIGDVDVASIAAGNNNIGDVDVASIAAGNNNIGDVDIASIAAGTNAIGKLAANSGVDIGDVDVTSIAAGTNLIGQIYAGLQSGLLYAGTTAMTPVYNLANIAASQTDADLVSAVASKRLRVVALAVLAGGTATNVTFNSKPAGAGTAISCLYACGANNGFALGFNPAGWFDNLNTAEGITVTTGTGATVGIQIVTVSYVP